MSVRIIGLLAAAASLASCASPDGSTPAASMYYDCGNGTRLKVEDSGDKITVQMNDNPPVTLPAVVSASGAKYMSAKHEFWSKGDEAMWTVGRMAPMTCRRVAVPRGM